jgi:hypothetical protein
MKRHIVTLADRLTRVALAVLALVLTGASLLVFDVVVGRTEGIVVGASVLVVLAIVWVVLPEVLRRRQ